MNKEEINSAVGILFFLCIIFVILSVFNAFGDEVRTVMLSLMCILSIGMIAFVCIKSIVNK